MKKGSYKIIVSFALLIFFLFFAANINIMVVKADDEISYEILLINSAANSEDNTIIENFNGSEEDIGILVNALESGIHPYNIYAPEYELPFPLLVLDMEDENLLRIFAKYGADYNYSNFRINGEFHSPLSFYVSDRGNSENIIKLLIELGMDPYREGTGRRAIWHAAKNHNTTALYYLLELGIDPDPVVPSRSPIKEAIKKEDFLTISMLLDANADIFLETVKGLLPGN